MIDLAARWQRDTLDLKPNLLSILIGINDTLAKVDKAESVETFQATYERLLTTTASALPDTKIILGEPFVLPVGKIKSNYASVLADVKRLKSLFGNSRPSITCPLSPTRLHSIARLKAFLPIIGAGTGFIQLTPGMD